MIRLLFVGDGERDAAMNPVLVRILTGAEVDPTTRAWARLHGHGGYERKVRFAIRQARDTGLEGVVATVDQDRSPERERLRELEAGRARDRETAPPLPTALGCARPHAEAWLLDDAHAVRTVLNLVDAGAVPNVRTVDDPKRTLNRLHAECPRAEVPIREILAELAARIVPERCPHRKDTGFAAFAAEVRREIGPLARRA
jgi:hypothetical protein